MSGPSHNELQQEFYGSGEHEHLRPRDGDLYADKLVDTLARSVGIRPEHRVLEVGAGFGRFSFALLRHCDSLVALDLSLRVLEELDDERDRRQIPRERCQTRCDDVTNVTADELGYFDFVVGFFILHHLPAKSAAIANLSGLVRPGGATAFLEPNRRNPLFLAQVACCPDMTWRDEKGMFKLSARAVLDDFRAAKLEPNPVLRFGFFPPALYNYSRGVRKLESSLESSRLLEPILPFLLLSARRPSVDRQENQLYPAEVLAP